MSTSSSSSKLPGQGHWQGSRRRTFSVFTALAVIASVLALWKQAPNYDSLDIWALPLLCAAVLVLQVLLLRRRVSLTLAYQIGFLAAALYVLLALYHQFTVYVPQYHTLSENTYWFAVLYVAVFLAFPARRALPLALGMVLLSSLICAWQVWHAVPPAVQTQAGGASVQFILSNAVIIAIQSTFGVQRMQLLATRAAAYTDPLTGLANRRAAEERLSALARARTPFTLVLFDLDHFKQVNDQHGHATGDLVLRGVGRLARAHLPRDGLAARWGGEEFLMILPPQEDGQVLSMLDLLRAELWVERHGAVSGMTACFGVATSRPAEHPDDVLARADAAMYSAKQQGRNDVRLAARVTHFA